MNEIYQGQVPLLCAGCSLQGWKIGELQGFYYQGPQHCKVPQVQKEGLE